MRQQLAVCHRTAKRPKLRNRDRFFWVCLSRLWNEWRSALVLVQPATVVKWHRAGFRLYWRWKSCSAHVGRPQVEREIRDLIPYPSAKWIAQQLVEAFPFNQAPRYLIRDNDSIYGDIFQRRVKSLGIEEILTPNVF